MVVHSLTLELSVVSILVSTIFKNTLFNFSSLRVVCFLSLMKIRSRFCVNKDF